jgi:hypothetical protein
VEFCLSQDNSANGCWSADFLHLATCCSCFDDNPAPINARHRCFVGAVLFAIDHRFSLAHVLAVVASLAHWIILNLLLLMHWPSLARYSDPVMQSAQ